jgi:hypothetical protein
VRHRELLVGLVVAVPIASGRIVQAGNGLPPRVSEFGTSMHRPGGYETLEGRSRAWYANGGPHRRITWSPAASALSRSVRGVIWCRSKNSPITRRPLDDRTRRNSRRAWVGSGISPSAVTAYAASKLPSANGSDCASAGVVVMLVMFSLRARRDRAGRPVATASTRGVVYPAVAVGHRDRASDRSTTRLGRERARRGGFRSAQAAEQARQNLVGEASPAVQGQVGPGPT